VGQSTLSSATGLASSHSAFIEFQYKACKMNKSTSSWELTLSLNNIALVLEVAGACIACASLAPLRDVAALVRAPRLRKAWRGLMVVVLCCILLLLTAAVSKYDDPIGVGDLAESGIHFLGPCFVLGVAWLSRRTAYETLRMAVLEEAAFVDSLTGLANRRRFNERLDDEVRRAHLICHPLSLIMVDIDHFKRVNDAHGHAAGDLVLKEVAMVLAANTRHSDTTCRFGREEFVIIVPSLGQLAVAELAEHLRRAIGETMISIPEIGDVNVTISVGTAALRRDDSPSSLAKRADSALYTAKRNGRDQVRFAA
jgi:diguanylate cyclase (GGDEF)-like protein